MKSTLLTLLVISIIFGSCQENQEPEIIISNNSFGGTFERRIGNEGGDTAIVILEFKDSTFEGNSLTNNYPAICNGTYKISGNRIEFTNQCSWSADVDQSLILNGRFRIRRAQGEIILTKEVGSGLRKITDIYTLQQMIVN